MKIKGEFVLREIAGDTILVPVGETALSFNGMITMNAIGKLIWNALEQGEGRDQMLQKILERFDVSEETAGGDLDEFLAKLEQAGFLED